MSRLLAGWLLLLVALTASPAWGQTTNRLYMTGAASGSNPSIQATGIDTNIGISLTPKGTGKLGIGTTAPQSLLQVYGGEAQVGSSGASCASGNAGALRWSGSNFQVCTSSSWTTFGVYDMAMFWPGSPPGSAIVRVVSARTATYPTSLTGSYCVAKSGATSSTAITINKVHSGTTTAVGTATFAAGGSANQTCTFTSASGISLVAGDVVEFVFPSTPDATLADIAITLGGTYQ